jgi:squalene synthase HpnC
VTEVVETPSGKQAGDENFPVGSWLLPAALRPHVAVFYDYARAIDDIADNPRLEPDDKVQRLRGFERAVLGDFPDEPGFAKAHAIRESMAATDVDPQHCVDLIAAFKQDAVKTRYAAWSELIDYCLLSASPVGRYLIDLHGETKNAYPASDALCNALQILNHLQDCQDDFRTLDRVYLPLDWMAEAGVEIEALEAPSANIGLRAVINRSLDGTEALLRVARDLPGQIRGTRFAMEAASILRIAERLVVELRSRDPLAERVVLSKPRYLLCGVSGAWMALNRGNGHIRD